MSFHHRLSRMRCVWVALLILTAPLAAGADDDTPVVVVDGHLHTFEEVLQLMDQYVSDDSIVAFVFGSFVSPAVGEVLGAEVYRDSTGVLVDPVISDSSQLLLDEADGAFAAGDYDTALALYRVIQRLEPAYPHILTLIGDSYRVLKMYDSATYYLQTAIDANPLDFKAWWYLADTFYALDYTVEALDLLTRAHVLNPCHQDLKQHIVNRRGDFGRGWDDWSFVPQIQMSEDERGQRLRVGLEWMCYGAVKMLWTYGDGYREKMAGDSDDPVSLRILEEKEALLAHMVDEQPDERLMRIVDDGRVVEFILYEILMMEDPKIVRLLTEESLERITEYVDTYH